MFGEGGEGGVGEVRFRSEEGRRMSSMPVTGGVVAEEEEASCDNGENSSFWSRRSKSSVS